MSLEEKRLTILAVDDTPSNIDAVKCILKAEYNVQATTSGKMALKILEKQKPDLILLDIMMPEMDGYEVLKQIRSDQSNQAIPVIFLTAKTDISDELEGFKLGAIDYITKPFCPVRLKARIKVHIELACSRQLLEKQNIELEESLKLREDIERITQHDLKLPLTSIIGLPQLLLLSDLTDRQKEMVTDIRNSGQTMLKMINLSLDLFKMERNLYNLTPIAVDIRSTILNVFSEQKSLAMQYGIELKILNKETEVLPKISGEPLLIYSLLSNLCKNAIEASPKDKTVSILVSHSDCITLTIENSGEVAEHIRSSFFDKFTTSGKYNGTGLGTYSAKLITEVQRGKIDLDSSCKGKTKVLISLPIAN